MSKSSRVADHCRAYALSHSTDLHFSEICEHPHDLECDRCTLFPSILKDIESVLNNAAIPQDEREQMKYILTQSRKNIESWKAHLLRSVNQDEARLDVLDTLEENDVLVVLDWAMKFLPRKHRESQTEWFGKRGISLHISVATRRVNGNLEMLTMIHVFQSCSQDSLAVLAVVDDIMKQLKDVMLGIKAINFPQDNAGCYHSAATILGIHLLASKHNVNVRMDFSDPQGGKGACDRKAASVKSHMKTYLNAGNDIETAEQMKEAIESAGGLHGVRVILCDLDCPQQAPKLKWEGVSSINNVKHEDHGMRVWRAYGIGKGHFVSWSDFENLKKISLPHLTVLEDALHPKQCFCPIKARKPTKGGSAALNRDLELQKSIVEDHDNHAGLFPCPEEGCIRSYQRHSSLQTHLDVGRHKYALERETFLDKAMQQYAQKLEEGTSSLESPIVESELAAPSSVSPPPQGWALKSAATSHRRLSKEQKKYLTDLFLIGERTGRKSSPDEVSMSMRKARGPDGVCLFSS